ncbi:5'-3' exonuclease PLD3-like [Gigantopelta aegis]|uniref:5'-3' exonuclease PLD3-like n=1 Tax=Gigantopelta aegis TaxID=1735272 RepID=UPI001B88C893|nr:5'-3' exonuclease PLD3-like [Gigantopelta aegis]
MKQTTKMKVPDEDPQHPLLLSDSIAVNKGSRWIFKLILPFLVTCLAVGLALYLTLVFLKPIADSYRETNHTCPDPCVFTLVESIPENLTYPKTSTMHISTFHALRNVLLGANKTVDIASFYWSLRGADTTFHDSSDWQGEQLFQDLLNIGKAGKVKIRIVQNLPTREQPSKDTKILSEKAGVEVRSMDFKRLIGNGILHTKMWLIDRKHFYVGSANMDWRSLTQVKELGVLVQNCSCLAKDMYKIFEVYWFLGKKTAVVPSAWPKWLSTSINANTSEKVVFNHTNGLVYLSSSPPQFCPDGRTIDIDAIVDVIQSAKEFVYIAVMDYFPSTLYTSHLKFWPVIDDALRRAAFDRGIRVYLLTSYWSHTEKNMPVFLKSFDDLGKMDYPKMDVKVKMFVVPSFTPEQAKIPYARVNHNKYMVTDQHAYIGTSNWSGDYFMYTGGIGFIVKQRKQINSTAGADFRQQLENVFLRDWNSEYSHPLNNYTSFANL